jgi:hypothetical protein
VGGVTVRNGPQEQQARINQVLAKNPSPAPNYEIPWSPFGIMGDPGEALAANAEYWNNVLKGSPTKVEFKLKNMTKEFTSNYPITVSNLKIPTGYNLEVT